MADSDYEDFTEYEFIGASGNSAFDCMVIGYRSRIDTPFSASELESWIIRFEPSATTEGNVSTVFDYGDTSWLTGLWRSLEGPVYVSNSEGIVHIRKDFKKKKGQEAWKEVQLEAQLFGIWGLSDTCVFTWGKAGGKHVMFRFDGKKWNPMPSPEDVSVLHGLSPDLLYAVGPDGTMARWDGQAWKSVRIAAKSHFTGLFVAGPDEMYATTEAGELWEGTSHGWSKRAEAEDSLWDVAKYKGEVWAAGGEQGLLRLKGKTKKLECIKPNVEATAFDARNKLLITTNEILVETDDGANFKGVGRDALRKFRENEPPMWED